jgi:rubrerythrin
MKYDFNADDIFQMAEEMERNGARFYRNAAASAQSGEPQQFLTRLAEMEDDHEKTFQALRADLTGPEKTPTVFDPTGESAMYLKALVDTRVFFEKEIDASSMKEILKAAIEAEKDSIVFYLGMQETVPDKMGKDRLDDIIKEEMGHIRLLAKELVKYR